MAKVAAQSEGGLKAQEIFGIISPPTPFHVQIGEVVYFDAGGSDGVDGTIVGYLWGFGDGQTGEGPSVQHVYQVPGSYEVTLVVTNDKGLSDTTLLEIQVWGLATAIGPPQASIQVNTAQSLGQVQATEE